MGLSAMLYDSPRELRPTGPFEVLMSMLLSIALNWMAKLLVGLSAGPCASAAQGAAKAGGLLQWLFLSVITGLCYTRYPVYFVLVTCYAAMTQIRLTRLCACWPTSCLDLQHNQQGQ